MSNIDYKLAEELEDAGFETKIIKDHLAHDTFPTLSELIEACGEGMERLEQFSPTIWQAGRVDYGYEGDSWIEGANEGKTPEEAVARLWLALNSNKK